MKKAFRLSFILFYFYMIDLCDKQIRIRTNVLCSFCVLSLHVSSGQQHKRGVCWCHEHQQRILDSTEIVIFTMLRSVFAWRQIVRSSTPDTQLRAIAASAHSSLTHDQPDNLHFKEKPLSPNLVGADVPAVVHKSFEEMLPCDIISLPGSVFNAPIRPDIVHRTVIWQLAKRRAGTAKTKGRSEVSGSGKKIRPQKGTGRSRQGARTSPIFRGGGRAHGPVPRDYSFPLPHNVRRNALRSVLTSKLHCGQLWVIEDTRIADAKTRSVVGAMERNQWESALIVDHDPTGVAGVNHSLYTASHNVRPTLAINALGLNVYDALSFDMLVLSISAVEHLRNRYSKYEWLF